MPALTSDQLRALDANLRSIGLSRASLQTALSDLAQDANGRWSIAPPPGGLFIDWTKAAQAIRAYEGDRLDPARRPTPAFAANYRRAASSPQLLLVPGAFAAVQTWGDLQTGANVAPTPVGYAPTATDVLPARRSSSVPGKPLLVGLGIAGLVKLWRRK